MAHRRSWAARILRGKPKTYEQDLDERCRKLPLSIQALINQLLSLRGDQCSTKYRRRTWTVAVLQEQGFRFSEAEPGPPPAPKKGRFWKSPKPRQPGQVTYLVVIRGVEAKVCEDARGFTRVFRGDNPWVDVDREEFRRKAREARLRRSEERRKRRCASPSLYPELRGRSSFESEFDGHRSRSPPSYHTRRDYSPASNSAEERARRYIQRSRNAPPRVPSAPPPMHTEPAYSPDWAFPPLFGEDMYGDRSRMSTPQPFYPSPGFDERFFPPPASESTWAPTVSAPSVMGWDQPTQVPSTPHGPMLATSPPPSRRCPIVIIDSPDYLRPSTSNAADGDDSRPRTLSTAPRPRSECEGCQATVVCEHFNKPTCDRPLRVQRLNGIDHYSHPDCFICMAKGDMMPREPTTAPCFRNWSREHRISLSETSATPGPSVNRPDGSPSVWPPPYSPGEHWLGDVFDEGDAATEIESGDDSDSDDEEATAVAESPQEPQEEPKE